MSQEIFHADVAIWLSQISSSPTPSPEPTPARSKCLPVCGTKRKRHTADIPESKCQRRTKKLRPALQDIPLGANTMETPEASPRKGRDRGRPQIPNTILSEANQTPQKSAPKERACPKLDQTPSTPYTVSPSKSSVRPHSSVSNNSGPKQTANVAVVRSELAEQGMYINNKEAYKSHHGFREWVEDIVLSKRSSQMRQASAKQISTWMSENAVADEKSYYTGLKPLVIKASRTVATAKRNLDNQLLKQARSFASDGLDVKENDMFTKHVLPVRFESKEKQLGLSTPQPDFAYGLKIPQFPDPTAPVLSQEAKSLIKVSPQLRHPFFVIENKGCERSIEEAENQAIRSGATMVAARRRLNDMANQNLDAAHKECDATPAAASSLGLDRSSIAFSCAWIPQMANIFVHWCEERGDGVVLYHMNRIRGYLMEDEEHQADFRADVHNILDYGVAVERKEVLLRMETAIAKRELAMR